MSGAVLVILWVLVYWLRGKNEDSDGDDIPGLSGWIIVAWMLWFFVPGALYETSPWLAGLALIILSAFIIPAIPAKIAIALARPKVAYFFGSASHIRFRRGNISGGLFYGYLAAMKVQDTELRNTSLRWLVDKLEKSGSPAFSGEIVMFVLIDAQLQNNADVSAQLKLLQWLPKRSISGAISRLAYRYALSSALNSGSIDEVFQTTRQWLTPAKNTPASYIKRAHVALLNGRKIDGVIFRMRRRYAGLPKSIENWLIANVEPDAERTDIAEMDHQTKLRTLYDTGINAKTTDMDLANDLIDEFSSDNTKEIWQGRAQELSIWNFESIWADLLLRLKDMRPSADQSGVIDQARYEKIDNAHKSLKYLESAIERSFEPKINGASVAHLRMWLKFLQYIQELDSDKQSEQTAFSNTYETLWNWAAALWNDKDDRRLACFIAHWCRPHAAASGYTDFIEVINFMTKNSRIY